MSLPTSVDSPHIISDASDGSENDNEAQEAAPSDTSLFLLLSPDLLRLVFSWTGTDDMKTYIRLATSGDDYIAHFIYTQCTFLWKHIDLEKFPGITDEQLHSLLERVNAQSVTESIVLDKTDSSGHINGTGLEPLRHSRVLKSVDLRQSNARNPGPTFLKNELVTDILSTMLPHKLTMVKVRRQTESSNSTFSEYYFSWGSFLTQLRISNMKRRAKEFCAHCEGSLAIPEYFEVQSVIEDDSMQCSMCNQYSCNAGRTFSLTCPRVSECWHCFESFCPTCRQVDTCSFCHHTSCSECEKNHLSCQWCGATSCSECKLVSQCMECHETGCIDCDTIERCDRCNESFCEGCRESGLCEYCDEWICGNCSSLSFCDKCEKGVCGECSNVAGIVKCQTCEMSLCVSCCVSDCFEECSCCGMNLCHGDPSCLEKHVCKSPGELVYSARNATPNDNKSCLCACGKKHLTSTGGQRFMCTWLVK